MTREEAIKRLEMLKVFDSPDHNDAIEMAISALRQQENVTKCHDLFDEDGGEILNDETVTDRHQMTNADRIRAMSDEEFVEWITAGENCVMTICDHICGGKCNAIKTFKKSSEEACKEIVMKWLRQPAEEDDHA